MGWFGSKMSLFVWMWSNVMCYRLIQYCNLQLFCFVLTGIILKQPTNYKYQELLQKIDEEGGCLVVPVGRLFLYRWSEVKWSSINLTMLWHVIKKNVCSHKATILVTVALCFLLLALLLSFTKENKNATIKIEYANTTTHNFVKECTVSRISVCRTEEQRRKNGECCCLLY